MPLLVFEVNRILLMACFFFFPVFDPLKVFPSLGLVCILPYSALDSSLPVQVEADDGQALVFGVLSGVPQTLCIVHFFWCLLKTYQDNRQKSQMGQYTWR